LNAGRERKAVHGPSIPERSGISQENHVRERGGIYNASCFSCLHSIGLSL
jgi:hypothetical protein